MDSGAAIDNHARPPVSKTAYVLQRMREDIAQGTIMPGQPLKQTDLAARYGVSPTPVREALRLLEADGSISYSPHRGATVVEMDKGRVRDLYLLRATMESLATRLAVERLTDDGQIERLQKQHQELTRARTELDATDLSRMNRELHFAIYTTGSPTISEHIGSLWRLLPTTATLWDLPAVTEVLVAQHGSIIGAMAERDAGGAAAYMYEHVMTAGRVREDRADG